MNGLKASTSVHQRQKGISSKDKILNDITHHDKQVRGRATHFNLFVLFSWQLRRHCLQPMKMLGRWYKSQLEDY